MRFRLLLVTILFSVSVHAQYDKIFDQMVRNFLNENYSTCIFIFESVYDPSQEVISSNSASVVKMAAESYLKLSNQNGEYIEKATNLLARYLYLYENNNGQFFFERTTLQSLTSFGSDTYTANRDSLKNLILEAERQFDLLYWNKRVKPQTYDSDAIISYFNLFLTKVRFCYVLNKVDDIHKYLIPEIYDIMQKTHISNIKRGCLIYFKTLEIFINSFKDFFDRTSNKDRLNYYLNLDILRNNIVKESNSSSISDVGVYTWRDIRNSLKNNEALIYVHRVWLSEDLCVYGLMAITRDAIEPLQIPELFSYESSSPAHIRNIIVSALPGMQKYWIIPIGDMCNVDIPEEDSRFCLRYSLAKMLETNHISHYQNNNIEYVGSFDYGNTNKVDPLNNDEYMYFKDKWPNRFVDRSANHFSLYDFCYPSKNVEIMHISTHGVDSRQDIDNAETLLFGNVSSIALALPSYAVNPTANVITTSTIIHNKYHHIGLIFLSICESSKSNISNGVILSDSNLSKAFSLAGAHNVVGYTQKVEETMATDFTKMFFEKIRTNNSLSYHDAFYASKKAINLKYGIKLNVMLWE